ncbi:MAG: hypothetical protein LAO04_04020 [Acidobacteriia bacterium]|nr:hypothetical protein [Terriglobia bacterium]
MNEEQREVFPGLSAPPEKAPPEAPQVASSTNLGLKIALVVLVLAASFGVTYGWLQRHTVRELASSRDELNASLAQTRSQADALATRLSDVQAQIEAARAAAEAPKQEEAPAPVAPPAPRRPAHRAAAKRPPADDPRWNQVQRQLSEQQKALAESKQQIAETQANLQQAKSELEGNLQSARNELGSGIARNHEELVALQKKGERNYYEFNVGKSRAYQHTGPISISLRKVNDKHAYCDLNMLVNDTGISKKHVNLFESVTFYPEGYLQPVELVINRIGKDFARGYVSEPKYRPRQQAAVPAPPPTTASANTPAPSVPDAQLAHRTEEAH